jgi:hypothetical protein
MAYLGRQGHLVTITSAGEHDFCIYVCPAFPNSIIRLLQVTRSKKARFDGLQDLKKVKSLDQPFGHVGSRIILVTQITSINCITILGGTILRLHIGVIFFVEYECPINPSSTGYCSRKSIVLQKQRFANLTFLASLFNGHYYYLVTGSLSFIAAKTVAESISYLRLQGHLVTISSKEERQFLQSTFGSSKFWIAASDAQQESLGRRAWT